MGVKYYNFDKMKNIIIVILGAVLLLSTSCKQEKTATAETPNTPQVKTVTPKKNGVRPAPSHADSPINWMTFEEAQEAMKKTPKKVFVDVYTYWCGPCKMLDRNTFSNSQLAEYVNENYYAVKFNAQEENDIMFGGNKYSNPNYNPKKGQYRRNSTHQLSHAFGVRAFPTMVILNEDLQIMQAVRGYKTPQQLKPILQQFAQL